MDGLRTTLLSTSTVALLLFACYFKTAFICVILCGCYHYMYYIQHQNLRACLPATAANVLLVIAHPDDEAMFFAPLLRQLSSYAKLHVFCCSNGNFYGQGTLRVNELMQSCVVLGVPQSRIKILNDAAFPDSPLAQWDISRLRSLIEEHCETSAKYDMIMTFGKYGVSGHPNHCALFRSLESVSSDHHSLSDECDIFVLRDTNLIRKYFGPFDICITVAGFLLNSICRSRLIAMRVPSKPQEIIFVNGISDYIASVQAMRMHASQLVWFRWLYIIFSRYMFVNVFDRISPTIAANE